VIHVAQGDHAGAAPENIIQVTASLAPNPNSGDIEFAIRLRGKGQFAVREQERAGSAEKRTLEKGSSCLSRSHTGIMGLEKRFVHDLDRDGSRSGRRGGARPALPELLSDRHLTNRARFFMEIGS